MKLKILVIKQKKNDHGNLLKSLKIDKEIYKKNYRSWIKKKILLFQTEILIGSIFNY